MIIPVHECARADAVPPDARDRRREQRERTDQSIARRALGEPAPPCRRGSAAQQVDRREDNS
jgi:hypothetical protein